MKLKSILTLIVFFFTFGSTEIQAGYLVPGMGVEGVLEIGREAGPGTDKKIWNERQGLKFKVDAGGIIVLIKCETADYATDENIRIGAPEADVLRRYGAPRNENKNMREDKVLYRYPGIGFAIRDGQVVGIYIFPRYKE